MEHSNLIDRIRNGEDGAFAELVDPHIERAYRTSFSILRSKDQAEEVVQTAMIEAYRNITEGKEINFFPTWFNRLVSHRSIDMVRKKLRLKEEEWDSYYQGKTPGIIDTLLKDERNGEIRKEIHSLENVDYRNVLILYYYQEFTIQEVADMLQINLSTVKSHLRRARIALKNQLLKNQVIGVSSQ